MTNACSINPLIRWTLAKRINESLAMNVSGDILFRMQDCYARCLDLADLDTLQVLLERCKDYLQLVCETSAWPSAAQTLLAQLPEGIGHDRKFVIGIYKDSDDLIGVLDAIRDYPAPNEWYLGLMLLDPLQRDQGLGARLYRAFEQWIIQLGAQHIRLGVVEQNKRVYRFWQRVGFMTMEKDSHQKPDEDDDVTIVMRRYLTV